MYFEPSPEMTTFLTLVQSTVNTNHTVILILVPANKSHQEASASKRYLIFSQVSPSLLVS